MGWLSSLFSGKAARIAQIQQAVVDQQTQARFEQQQAAAAARQEELLKQQNETQAASVAALTQMSADTAARIAAERESSQKTLAELSSSNTKQLELSRSQADAVMKATQARSEDQLRLADETAKAAQKAAEEAAARAAMTPADSEDARSAADRRLRKLNSRRGFASTVVSRTGKLGSADVAVPQLLGA